MENTNVKKQASLLDIRNIAQIGILSAIAFILMTVEIPLWFAPGFYRLDLSELPVLVGSFAMGPLAGVLIEMVKVLLYFFVHGSSTAGVGDFANFIFGCSFVVPAALFYKREKTKKNALVGLAVGTVLMAIVGGIINAYVLLPLYASAFHMPMNALIQMGTKVNPSITNLTTFILLAVVPFNLFKGVVVSVLTMLLYKRVSPILHGRIH
ncbi:MAG TPA: ECF transporter S component [Caproicibacter sp.]|nr:ECF transporter S component [Caproicibacter sp.]